MNPVILATKKGPSCIALINETRMETVRDSLKITMFAVGSTRITLFCIKDPGTATLNSLHL